MSRGRHALMMSLPESLKSPDDGWAPEAAGFVQVAPALTESLTMYRDVLKRCEGEAPLPRRHTPVRAVNDIPGARRGASHRQVGLAVAVVIGGDQDVVVRCEGEAPLPRRHAPIRAVDDIPGGRQSAPHRKVGLAVGIEDAIGEKDASAKSIWLVVAPAPTTIGVPSVTAQVEVHRQLL